MAEAFDYTKYKKHPYLKKKLLFWNAEAVASISCTWKKIRNFFFQHLYLLIEVKIPAAIAVRISSELYFFSKMSTPEFY